MPGQGGQGVLLKTAPETYEAMVVRDPGSLKVAQADNPKRWGYGMNRIMLNWSIREIFGRGKLYAEAWQAHEADPEGVPAPAVDPQWEIFRDLFAHEVQISAHTQVHQVVLASMDIMAREYGLDLFIDHGTFDGYKATDVAIELDVPAILGPRSINMQVKGRGIDTDGRIVGVAAEYQRRGHPQVGFNTDAPVMPQEELQLQATVAARHGFRDESMQTILGLTIVPARIANISHRTGSIEVGKDADILQITGHPADPRSAVNRVWIEGHEVYDAEDKREY